MSETYLFYSPSKGQIYGHYVRSKNHIETAIQLHNVVEKFCKKDSDQEKKIELSLDAGRFNKNEQNRKNLIQKILEKFGEKNPNDPANSNPNDIFKIQQWIIPYNKLQDVVEFYTKNYSDELAIVYSYKLNWIDKSRSYGLMVIQLSKNKFLVTTKLHLPYEIDDKRLLPFLSDLNDTLPFALSEKHFRYTISNKSGTSYNYRKLDPEFTKILSNTLKKKNNIA